MARKIQMQRFKPWMVTVLVALWVATPADAQSMDYGSLEKLFDGPVTTSATGAPQRDTDVPANMSIITADEIRRSGARDIPGVLRHVPGIDVMQWSSDHSDVSIRGYDQAYASRTLVMIDGRTVYADCYGFIPWSSLPVELSDIRQIEVVRGPNAALFGFNAADGAINIITKNPRYDDVNALSLRLGSPDLGEISGVATVRLNSDGVFRVSGGYQRNKDFSTAIPPEMTNVARQDNGRASIDANLVYALGANLEIGLEASHTHADRNEVSPDYVIQASKFETNSLEGRATADTSVGFLQFAAYTNWFGWKGSPAPGLGQFSMHNQITVAQVEDIFNIDADNTVRLALSYRHNSVNTTPVPGATLEYDVFSGSAMWNWQIAPSLAWTNAVRLDHLEPGRDGFIPPGYPFKNSDWAHNLDQISFNSGLVWSTDDDDTLRFMVARGAQLPSLVDSGALLILSPLINVTGHPNLKPTAVMGYEITWDRKFPRLNTNLRVALFREDSTNLIGLGGGITFGPGMPPPLYATPANIGASHAHGLEASADGRFGQGWRWSVSYRLEAVSDRFLPIASDGSDFADYEHTTPKHLLKAGLGWADERWETDIYVIWQSNSYGLVLNGFDSRPVPIGAFATADARIGYRLTDWATLALSGQNLLQDHQRQTSGPEVGRQVYLTLTLENW